MASATNPISGHEVNITPGNTLNPNPSGWIRLLNGVHDAGYINLMAPGEKMFDPSLETNPPNGPPYIVVWMPMSDLPILLNVLRNEGKLQIRFDSDGAPPPFAIIEPMASGTGTPPTIAKTLRLR